MKKVVVIILAAVIMTMNTAFAQDVDWFPEAKEKGIASVYKRAQITPELSLEELESMIDVPIEKIFYGSAIIANTAYASTMKGIYRISSNGETMFYPYHDTPAQNVEMALQLFVVDKELHAIIYSDLSPQVDRKGCYFGKIDLSGKYAELNKTVQIDQPSFDNYQSRNSFIASVMRCPIVYNDRLYCITTHESKTRLSSYDIGTGKEEKICEIPSVNSLIPYKDGQAIVLRGLGRSVLAELGVSHFSVRGPNNIFELDDWLAQPRPELDYLNSQQLQVIELSTGEVIEEIHAFGDSELSRETNGTVADFAFDRETNYVYYCSYGELHRFEGGDFSTNLVVDYAPGNLLNLSPASHLSGITEDGHYMHIVSTVGVDIFCIN